MLYIVQEYDLNKDGFISYQEFENAGFETEDFLPLCCLSLSHLSLFLLFLFLICIGNACSATLHKVSIKWTDCDCSRHFVFLYRYKIDYLMQCADTNKDGLLDYREFTDH